MIALHRCIEFGPHFGLSRDIVFFLMLQQEAQGSSQIATGIWRNLLSCKKGDKASFPVPYGNS